MTEVELVVAAEDLAVRLHDDLADAVRAAVVGSTSRSHSADDTIAKVRIDLSRSDDSSGAQQ